MVRRVVLRAGGRSVQCLLLTGCLILGVLGLGVVEAHAATPTSLVGETFTSREVKGSTVSGQCINTFSQGSFHFSVSGTAAGPFPGTFMESGSFATDRSGYLESFSSAFTITSTVGTVTGTGSLAADSLSRANCFPIGTVQDVTVDPLATSYAATINGAQHDAGSSTISLKAQINGDLFSFSESFGATGVVHEQCKHGGWKSFGPLFKNQGDCVSFFATRRKNPPSGS
jgi:hypothetical protein